MANSKNISILISAKDEASKVIESVGDNFTNSAKKFQSAGRIMSDTGSTLTRSLTLPLAGLGAGALKMAGDFEQSLNILQSVTGATDAQMTTLRQTARALGNDVSLPGISAKDAAGAMTELAKAGLDVNDTLAASKGVLSLAKAGQIDVSSAAMTAARALNAFGLEGSEANRIADLLAASANASTSSVEDMALGLQMVGAQSHSMGVSLQDTVTALAMFSNAGINGSDAGTSLKTMFIQLASPTKEASELMTQLGLDFFDAKGNFIGLASTADLLNKKLGTLTVEQRNSALATIFGSDATRVASILAEKGAGEFNSMAAAVTKQGAATELAAAQNKGFNGALDNLKSTAETAFIDIGTVLLPLVTRQLQRLADTVKGVSDWFNGLSEGQQNFIFNTLAMVAAVGPAVLVLGKLSSSLGSIIAVATTVSRLVGIGGIAGSAVSATSAIAGGGGLLAALGPLGIAMGGIALVAGGAWLAFQKFKDAGDGLAATTTGLYTPVSLLTLAQDREKQATDAVTAAFRSLDSTRQQHKTTIESLKVSQDNLRVSHDQVKAALDQFGAASPQYQAAVAGLNAQQTAYNQQLLQEWNLSIAVRSAEEELRAKRGELRDATWTLNDVQWRLNNGLQVGLDVVRQFGPTAAAQAGAIANLQSHIGGVVAAWNGWNGQLHAQLPNQVQLLQGLGGQIDRVQGQGSNLVTTLQQASTLQVGINNTGIQGGSPNMQGGHALGTNYAPGGRTLVGEHGPEYVDLPRGSKVYTAEESRGMSGGGEVTNVFSGQFIFKTAEAVDAFLKRVDKTQRLAQMGMA